jgi:hypothetical protein
VTGTQVAGEHTCTERLQWTYSSELTARQQAALETHLRRAETELLALTPQLGCGKRAVRDEETLRTKITTILTRHQVSLSGSRASLHTAAAHNKGCYLPIRETVVTREKRGSQRTL